MPRHRQEDLHGFDRKTALDFALLRVREAYLNGYETIELVHGAADVHSPVEEGRGGIKWELREMLDHGIFDPYCVREESWPRGGSLHLKLKRNGRPRAESWEPAPRRAYRRGL